MTTPDVKSVNGTNGHAQLAGAFMENIGPTKEAVLAAFASSQEGLKLVENKIKEQLCSQAPLLEQIPQYLLNQGGKRIRPVLALLTARLFKMEKPSEQLIEAAAGIELIHMATLLHDDIIDESPTRRHQKSAYKEFGMMPSLLAGDFLLVRAFGLCAKLDAFIIEETEKACIRLTEGEILEGFISPDNPRELDEYIDIVDKKTAALFSLACAVGSHLSQNNTDVTEKLKQFGSYSGIAFQMVDDVLDVTADEDLLGKPAGTDIRQKTPSLVNILWLESGDPTANIIFSKDNVSEDESKQALSHLKDSEVITKSREIAVEYAKKATDILDELEESSIDTNTRDQLKAIIQYTLERCL